jgi:BMFP domain-containing protein YqiC
LVFPFGFMTMMIMRARGRRRALEARLSEVEGKLADLTDMVSQAEVE